MKKTIQLTGVTLSAQFGPLTVSKDIQGYNYYESHNVPPEKQEFTDPLPEPQTDTAGFAIAMPNKNNIWLPDHVEKSRSDSDNDEGFTSGYLAALHAIEHALIGLLPTTVLCDRQDIGGLSTEAHIATNGPAIFIHDGHDGGAGLSRAAFDEIDTLLRRTYDQIRECDCTTGCNRCVLSEYCGSANRDIWKEGAIAVLEQLFTNSTMDTDTVLDPTGNSNSDVKF
jgi:Distinct helicase family with a unique C-terminal domain including a metal-binding cysteine cluster